jgi:calcineurin-like phosphoesterase family protein
MALKLGLIVKENETMRDVWFTSDFHFGHFNIIRYCNRPFADTREMNAAILERLNASVKRGGLGYYIDSAYESWGIKG